MRTRLHDLRHAAVTQMIAAGVPLAVVAGGSDLAFTVRQYGHLRPEHLPMRWRRSLEAAIEAAQAYFINSRFTGESQDP